MLRLPGLTVDKVVEINHKLVDPHWLFTNFSPDYIALYAEEMGPSLILDGQLVQSFHSYVIRTKHKNILVDTCNGNHKQRTFPWQHMLASDTYLNNLARIGLRPEDIDVVLCTHLHADHVGWNTQLINGAWVPTFPNAKYLFSRADFDHYMKLYESNPVKPVNHGSFADSILPVVREGLADIVDTDHVVERHLDDGVWLEPSPGHTPGHFCVRARSAGQECLMTGDAIHHPIQLHEPGLICIGDLDPAAAHRSRQAMIDSVTDTGTLFLTMHFPSPTAGHIVSTAQGPRFRFTGQQA